MKKRGANQKTFDVSISGKSNAYTGYALDDFLKLLATKGYTEHSTVRMKPLTHNSDKGNGWLIRNIQLNSSIEKALSALAIEADTRIQTLSELEEEFIQAVEAARKLSRREREQRLSESGRIPKRTTVTTTVFIRNPYVVAATLERANGKCERCYSLGSFTRRSDSSPYLEVHHVTPLAMNGEDIIGNAIALCPNCHRELHFGKNASGKNT